MSTDITTLGMAVDSSGVRRATDDLDRMSGAGKRAAESATEVEGSMTKSVLAANQLDRAIAATVSQVSSLVGQFVELGFSVGNYQDIAERVASDDPAGLASLRTAADVAGTTVDAVASSINRMALQLAKTDESKSAGRALKLINIELAEFKRLDPVEQYRTLAKQLDQYADSQAKVQILQAVTGRGGADQLVMMKELAGETERSNFLTTEQIKLADEIADRYARQRSQTRQYAEVLALQMLPSVGAVNEALTETIKALLGVDEETGKLKSNDGVADFADGAVRAFGFVIDAGDGVIRIFDLVGKAIGAIAAASVAFAHGEFKEADAIMNEFLADRERILERKLFSDRLNDALAKARSGTSTKEDGGDKPRLSADGLGGNSSAKKQKDEYAELIASLQERLGIGQQELELGRKLAEDEKLRIEVYAKVSTFKKLLKADQLEAIDGIIEEIGAVRRLNEETERLLAAQAAEHAARKQLNSEQQRSADAAEELARASEEQLMMYGKTEEELSVLSITLLRHRAAQLLAEKAIEEAKGETTAYTAALGQEADALLRAAESQEALNNAMRADREEPLRGAERAVRSYLERIKDAGTETERVVANSIEGLEDILVDLSTGGKADIKSLIDYMIAEFMRLRIIRPMLNEIFGAMEGGGIGSLIGSLLGIFGFGANTEDFRGTELPGSLRGGKASGGRVDPFTIQPVNERGPELLEIGGSTYLMSGGSTGNVIPNEKIGGTTISITSAPSIHVDARSDAAQVEANIRKAVTEGNKALLDELQAQGVI